MANEESVSKETPVKATTEWQDRQVWELQIRLGIRKEYEELFAIWQAKDLKKLADEQQIQIEEGLEKLVAKAQEEQKPPSEIELQQLLDKQYLTFKVKVDYVDADGKEESELFTIRELPQSVEKKFYRQFKTQIIDKAQMLEALTQAGMDQPFEDKAKAFLELFDESFDMLADAVVWCLNPFNKNSKVDRAWVQNNIGSDRQWGIVQAQIEVNRLRDFFSKVSQSGQRTMTTMRAPNFQQLQQLVR